MFQLRLCLASWSNNKVTSQGLLFQLVRHPEEDSSKLLWPSRYFKGPGSFLFPPAFLSNGFYPHVFKLSAILLRNYIHIPVSKVVEW